MPGMPYPRNRGFLFQYWFVCLACNTFLPPHSHSAIHLFCLYHITLSLCIFCSLINHYNKWICKILTLLNPHVQVQGRLLPSLNMRETSKPYHLILHSIVEQFDNSPTPLHILP